MAYSFTPPPFPTTPAAPLFPAAQAALLPAEALLLRGAAVADELSRALRDGQRSRQRSKRRFSAVDRNMRFVNEESIAAQCGRGNDALRCTRDAERDLEV